MFSLQSLRKASWIGRLVLGWLLLATVAALASPLIKPPTTGMVCSSAGWSTVAQSFDDGEQAPGLTPECPLCTSLCAPPPAIRQTATALPAPARLACPLSAPRATASCAAALPARGPPALS